MGSEMCIRDRFGHLFLPSTPQKAGRIIDDSYERYYAMAEPDFDWEKGPGRAKPRLKLNYWYMIEMMTGILEESYHKIHDLYLRNISDNRASQLIIALRHYKNKHGRWPATLEDVKSLASPDLFVDPINNDSYVYRLTEDGFTLYSKGKNNIDDGGVEGTEKADGTDTDDFRVWPQKNRRIK